MSAMTYDFTKPVRLTAEWQQRLTGWFQSACTLANRAWAKQLPAGLELSLGPLDACYAQQSLSRLPATVIGYRVVIGSGQLPTLLVLPRVLLLQLVALILGDAAAPEDREPTLVEDNLAEYFLAHYW